MSVGKGKEPEFCEAGPRGKTGSSKRPALGHLAHAAIIFWLGTLISEYCTWNAYSSAWKGFDFGRVLLCIAGALLVLGTLVAVAWWVSRVQRRRSAEDAAANGADMGCERRSAEDAAASDADVEAALCGKFRKKGKPKEGTRLKAICSRVLGWLRRFSGLLPIVLALLCSCACSCLYWNAWANDVLWLQEELAGEGHLIVELVGDPVQRDYGQVSQAQVKHGNRTVSLRVLWSTDADAAQPPSSGHCVRVSGAFKAASLDDSGRWNHQQGYAGTLKASSFEDAGLAPGLRGFVTPLRDASMELVSALGGDAAGLLGGILLGDKTQYSGSELEQDFKTTGLAHLMAVSGTHLAVVMALAGWFLARLPLPRGARALLLTALLSAYVALTAFAPSAMRACVMAAVGMGGFIFARRRHVLSSLALCVIAFLALQPSLAFSLGYQLSVLCMVGLLVLSPLLSAWMAVLFKGRLGGVGEAIAATLSANLMTLPVTIPLFCQLPLISPVSTFLASPFITVALGLGIPVLLIAAVAPPLGGLLLSLAGAAAAACAALVHALADLPGACVPLDASAGWLGALCLVGVVALWGFWPLPRQEGPERPVKPAARFAGVGVVAAMVLPVLLVLLLEMGGVLGVARLSGAPVESDAQVVMLDVGQGDAMLVCDGDAAVLIDTGEEGTVLLKALARHGVSSLDAVLLSHKDSDHTGALSSLAGIVQVRRVMMHEGLVGSDLVSGISSATQWVTGGSGLTGVEVGDAIRVGRFSLRLVAPQEAGESENDDSLIWLLSYDDDGDGVAESRGLLVGDGEEGAIEPAYRELGDIEFYKVAHHGSRDAISTEEMAVLKPELSLISVGADNKYGHPTAQTLQVLEEGGSKVLRTDLSGDITLSFSGTRIGVSTQK